MNVQVQTWIYGTLEPSTGLMDPNTQVNSVITTSMAKVPTNGLMEEGTMENGRTTSSMASDSCANEYSFLWL